MASYNDAAAVLCFSSRVQEIFGWSFLNVFLREAVRQARLGTNCLKTLKILRLVHNSVFGGVPEFCARVCRALCKF